MTDSHLRLNPGTVVVFEGLDRTGKSTQAERLRRVLLPGSAFFAHMPTGATPFSNDLARLLESRSLRPSIALASQLAHLASHADSVPELVKAAANGGLVLDRWWWSTVAYGWFGGRLADTGISEGAFRELVGAVWKQIRPSIVFVFVDPHQKDPNNTPAIADGYRTLVSEDPRIAMFVPAASAADTEAIITSELLRRGLARKVTDGT